MKNKIIFIFIGLPRKIDKSMYYFDYINQNFNSKIIFSTNEDIYNYNLPDEVDILINEKSQYYKNKFSLINHLPEYNKILQWIRLSDALKYVNDNNLANEKTLVVKLRSDISNLDKIIIPKNITDDEIYMYTDYAFVTNFKNMKKLDENFFNKPQVFFDKKMIMDIRKENFIRSDKRAARFEWLYYPNMISTFLPKKIFRYLIKTKLEKLLWLGPKNFNNPVCMRYHKDLVKFPCEVILLWNILMCGLNTKSLSSTPLKLFIDRKD